MRVVAQEVYEYSDPVTEFLRKLFVEYDFQGARESLAECEEVRRRGTRRSSGNRGGGCGVSLGGAGL